MPKSIFQLLFLPTRSSCAIIVHESIIEGGTMFLPRLSFVHLSFMHLSLWYYVNQEWIGEGGLSLIFLLSSYQALPYPNRTRIAVCDRRTDRQKRLLIVCLINIRMLSPSSFWYVAPTKIFLFLHFFFGILKMV